MRRSARVRRSGAGAAPGGPALDRLLRTALREDLGRGDITTQACLPAGLRTKARIRARRPCVACGLAVAARVFKLVDPRIRFRMRGRDGRPARPGATLAELEGPAAGILAGERVALNLLQHLSGIASRARRCTRTLAGTGTKLFDTRKTHPGLRDLEKYAVRCGGAANHRQGLHDAILIKDNHVALAGGVGEALRRARRRFPRAPLAVEVDDLAQLRQAVECRAGLILLDNFPLPRLRRAVRLYGRQATLEASGGIRPETLRRIARTGVGRISMGALTHSVSWADIGLDIDFPRPPRARR